MIKQYQVTDGKEWYADLRWFSPQELILANLLLKYYWGKEYYWGEVTYQESDADYFMETYSSKY